MTLSVANSSLIVVPLLAYVVLGWVWVHIRSPFRKIPYPPGPPVQNLITGNIRDLPTTYTWRTFMDWGKKYGDIVHFRVFDKHTVILNSYEANVDLLEKRSAIYSGRMYMPMLELMGFPSFDLAFMQHGDEWRAHRRTFKKMLRSERAAKYIGIQTCKVHDFLYGLLTTPEDVASHQRTLPAAIIMGIMYGHDVLPKDDEFVTRAERAMAQIVKAAGLSAASLLYIFPILRFLPGWFPGAGFQRFARQSRDLAFAMRDAPIGIVKKQMKEGTATDCATVELLESCRSKEEFDMIAGVAATAYIAGSDTTVSPISTFLQTMILFPEVQKRAKEEIDAVIGLERLVAYEDRPSLPYIEAIYREVLRWRPVVPLSLPHTNTSDDVYKGYYIPEGTSIVTNVWAIAYDPERYFEPEKFNPSRFLDANGNINNDTVSYVFGFGRRVCPGRHLASSSLWLTIASVIQNFDISKKRDAMGNQTEIDGGYQDGLILYPVPFECSITVRSSEARNNILNAKGVLAP